jgi:pimeloyl-ACP methyl ester carboxylesterase
MTNVSLPHPLIIDGLSYLPPPSAKAFEEEFAGILPPGKDIKSSWGVTHYYDFSPEASHGARRVLLIHGVGTSAIGMAPLARRLTASGSHVITYDLWGHGNSSTPLEAHTAALMHAQLFELLSHLRWSTAHLVGFSFGGSMLATFAALHPHIPESLTIVAGAGLWTKKGRSWWSRLWTDGGWGLEWLGHSSIMGMLEGDTPSKEGWKERLKNGEVDCEPIERWERENHPGHAASVVSMFRYGGVFDQHESYRKLVDSELKILVIVGEKDSVFEAEMVKKELGAMGWKKSIKQVDGAGHDVVRSHPQDVAALIRDFWDAKE